MMQDKVFNNVATELEEIFSYLDKSVLNKIPIEIREHVHKIKNNDYYFKLDKTKRLIEQELLLETKEVLSVIFIKYCCTDREVDEILNNHSIKEKNIEDSKIGLEELQKVFEANKKNDIEENKISKEIIKIERVSWYKSIIKKIKSFFKIK